MLQTHDTHMRATRIIGCLLLGSASWIALLVTSSRHISNYAQTNNYDVRVGPFVLNTLTRHEQSSGLSATLSFESGLLWYFGFWLGVGVIWEIANTLVTKHKNESHGGRP